ncbi:MAG: NADH-quinone oxidoreductase subunit NuoE [Candidatus Woesearchaeota archaeon]
MVFVRKVSVQGDSYYYLFHIKRSGGTFRKYKKYIGKNRPSGERLKKLKSQFRNEIAKEPGCYERPHNLNVVEILQKMQSKKGYISKEDIIKLSKELHIPAVDLVGVASFYSQFTFTKPGKYTIKMCNGTACHVKKSPELTKHVKQTLGVNPGEVTADGLFGFESVNCIGACARAPAMMINDKVYGELTKDKVTKLIEDLKGDAASSSAVSKTGSGAARKASSKKSSRSSKKKTASRSSPRTSSSKRLKSSPSRKSSTRTRSSSTHPAKKTTKKSRSKRNSR